MSNLDTPKAIIVAALILSLSATIVFMFRYNYAVSEVSVCFNHLTGTPYRLSHALNTGKLRRQGVEPASAAIGGHLV